MGKQTKSVEDLNRPLHTAEAIINALALDDFKQDVVHFIRNMAESCAKNNVHAWWWLNDDAGFEYACYAASILFVLADRIKKLPSYHPLLTTLALSFQLWLSRGRDDSVASFVHFACRPQDFAHEYWRDDDDRLAEAFLIGGIRQFVNWIEHEGRHDRAVAE